MTSLLIETYEYNLQQNRIDPFNEMHTEDYGELEGLENHFVWVWVTTRILSCVGNK